MRYGPYLSIIEQCQTALRAAKGIENEEQRQAFAMNWWGNCQETALSIMRVGDWGCEDALEQFVWLSTQFKTLAGGDPE
jgi:hypothetical protein